MKTLYESILDTDNEIVDKTKQALAPSIILKALRDVFGQFIDDEVHPSSEYLGSLNDGILDYFNSKKDPLAELKKHISKFQREINKVEGFKASTKKTLDNGNRLKYIVFRTIIEYKGSDVRSFYGLSFGVRYDMQLREYTIPMVAVISVDGDLIELENRSNILKGK